MKPQCGASRPRPRSINKSIPKDLEAICLKCLEKKPERRYASAKDLADDLRNFIDGENISARPLGVFGRMSRWARRRPFLAVTLVALLVFYLNHLTFMALGVPGEGGTFHKLITLLVLIWAAGAVLFQRLSTWSKGGEPSIYSWAVFDVAMLTLILLIGDGPRSILTIAYPILIASTALRFRIMLVWTVAGLSGLSYALLVLDAHFRRPSHMPDLKHWVIFIISLFVFALIQQAMLRRSKAGKTTNQ